MWRMSFPQDRIVQTECAPYDLLLSFAHQKRTACLMSGERDDSWRSLISGEAAACATSSGWFVTIIIMMIMMPGQNADAKRASAA
jgi:hypothetical protein